MNPLARILHELSSRERAECCQWGAQRRNVDAAVCAYRKLAFRRFVPHSLCSARSQQITRAICGLALWLRATALVLVIGLGGPAQAVTRTWTGTGDWFANPTNWTTGIVPGDGDDAVVASGSVLLTNSTAQLGSLTITNATLTCSNWSTTILATNVVLQGGATITLPGDFYETNMSNRVSISCVGLTLDAGAIIDTDGLGYHAQNGPGAPIPGSDSIGPGAGHGGYGGAAARIHQVGGSPYGIANAPTAPGSGGGRAISGANGGGPGGGAIRIDAVGVTNNGTITARGADGAIGPAGYGGGGSGGSIYITCSNFSGTASGLICADGGDSRRGDVNSGPSAGGSGGRIALLYTNVTAGTKVRCSAARGAMIQNENPVGLGTLYFSDDSFLSDTMDQVLEGHVVIPGLTSFVATNDLRLTNGTVALGGGEFTLTVSNDLVVSSGAGLALGRIWGLAETTTVNVAGAVVVDDGELSLGENLFELGGYVTDARLVTNFPPATRTFMTAGSLSMTNGDMYVYSSATNAGEEYGALITVNGDVGLVSNSWIYPASHPTNGGSALFRMDDLMIDASSGFSADSIIIPGRKISFARGFRSWDGPGTGDGSYGGGAGHGGAGGDSGNVPKGGPAYGLTNAPVHAGSGGGRRGAAGSGGPGGGAVLIEAAAVTLNGRLSANGSAKIGSGQHGGGGAGGTVFVHCDSFAGDTNGVLSATGGDGGPGASTNGPGGGGGGRIAVWYDVSAADAAILKAGEIPPRMFVSTNLAGYLGTASATNGLAFNGGQPGGPGTLVFLTILPPAGTVVVVR